MSWKSWYCSWKESASGIMSAPKSERDMRSVADVASWEMVWCGMWGGA